MSSKKYLLPLILLLMSLTVKAELIEEIYAVVNDEIITYSELTNAYKDMIIQLQSKYKGEELEKKIEESKALLFNNILENKLITSKAKEKEYDVEAHLRDYLKRIRKQFSSEEEFVKALQSNNLTLDDFKKKQRIMLVQQRYLMEEAYKDIKIDNTEIMGYFKRNIKEFTLPEKMELNCIFIKTLTDEKKAEILEKLKSGKFPEVAAEYSELTDDKKTNAYLGEFTKGELDASIEDIAIKMKDGEVSDWITNDSGSYIIQMKKFTPSTLREYKDVREQIHGQLRRVEEEKAYKIFIERLKKESYIKIYKKF